MDRCPTHRAGAHRVRQASSTRTGPLPAGSHRDDASPPGQAPAPRASSAPPSAREQSLRRARQRQPDAAGEGQLRCRRQGRLLEAARDAARTKLSGRERSRDHPLRPRSVTCSRSFSPAASPHAVARRSTGTPGSMPPRMRAPSTMRRGTITTRGRLRKAASPPGHARVATPATPERAACCAR